MSEKCPFCMTIVNDGATVCGACRAYMTKKAPNWVEGVVVLLAFVFFFLVLTIMFKFGVVPALIAMVVFVVIVLALLKSASRRVWVRSVGS